MSVRRLVVLISAVAACAMSGLVSPGPSVAAVGGTSISATKTMSGHLVRSFSWALSKDASPSALTLDAGQSATVQFTVGATRSDAVLSAYFEGQICVRNTGAFATQGLRIVDAVSKPSSKAVLASTVVDVSAKPVLTPGESHCYPYRIDLPSGVVPGATYKDTATVSIANKSGKASGPAPSATAALPLTAGTVNNASITVSDTNGSTFTFSGSGTRTYAQSFGCPADAGTHVNTVSTPGFAPASATVTVTCPAADLSVTKTADASSVSAGDPVGFTVSVANDGLGAAAGVSLSDSLPASVSWSIASQTSDACAITGSAGSQVLVCTIGAMAAGATYVVHVTAVTGPEACGTLSNTATVSATNDDGDSSTDTVTILCPDLSVTKTADASSVSAGDPVGFTVVVVNGGLGTAAGVSLSDPLPAPVSWSIASQTSDACAIVGPAGSQVLVCTIGSMAGSATYVVHVVAATGPEACGILSNTATVTATNDDGDTSTDTTTIVC